MRRATIGYYSILAIVLIILQVTLLSNIALWGVATPFLFLYLIMKLPVSISPNIVMTVAFAMGLTIDMFFSTPGVYTLSSVVTAFMRRPYITLVLQHEDDYGTMYPSIRTLGTAPFTLLFFDKLSFWSVITNLWIVPLVYIVFCIGMFSSLFYYIYPPVTYMLRYLCEPCIYIIIKTARVFSNLKFGIISPDYTPWCFYAYYTAFFFLLIHFIKRKNNVRP